MNVSCQHVTLGLVQQWQVAADQPFSRAMVCCSLLLSLAVEQFSKH